MRRLPILLAALVSTTAYALPPGSAPVLRGGANHHIGDDSFVAGVGRAPTAKDPEGVRMTTHLQHVHDWLASRPATRPELAAKRKAILDALARYIQKGTTPRNFDLPWRTPVFIDEQGTICAVGFLIESTEGRALPEKIAKLHRYDFIEDIAKDMPEVQRWIAESGLTLDEVQTIQPAYEEPPVREWRGWDLVKYPPKDGRTNRYGTGTWKHRNMDGDWKVLDGEKIIGEGQMKRGRGEWTSFYDTGERLAQGPYRANTPEGYWRIFHKSGNLAAEGELSGGMRVGAWRFYYDTPARTPIAVGRFAADGSVEGTWHHYDSDGKLLARSWTETPTQWQDNSFETNGGEGSVLDVMPGADGVHHVVHQGTPGKDVEFDQLSLEMFAKGGERLFIQKAGEYEAWYGADGVQLVHADTGTWTGTDCHWSELRKQIAGEGDVARLDGVLSNAHLHGHGPTCRGTVAISRERAAKLDELLASRDRIRAATPRMVRELVLSQEEDIDHPSDPKDKDLAQVLAGNMAMYVAWPHVDRRFKQLYATMAGRYVKHWASRSADDDDVNVVDDRAD